MPSRPLRRDQRHKGRPCDLLCGSGEPGTHPVEGTNLSICTPCWVQVETIETEAATARTLGVRGRHPAPRRKQRGAA